eukprot:TRINITY_DN19117_c0_g1_i1.p1 TRINITY_DN19117_c0_g1~~TRINITY_DN19117_c0_g1_i1.p1  ORF type:complete len:140 (-),score=22.10 TRINITY_DN19117_c0_g1_i1:29-418(-)
MCIRDSVITDVNCVIGVRYQFKDSRNLRLMFRKLEEYSPKVGRKLLFGESSGQELPAIKPRPPPVLRVPVDCLVTNRRTQRNQNNIERRRIRHAEVNFRRSNIDEDFYERKLLDLHRHEMMQTLSLIHI